MINGRSFVHITVLAFRFGVKNRGTFFAEPFIVPREIVLLRSHKPEGLLMVKRRKKEENATRILIISFLENR